MGTTVLHSGDLVTVSRWVCPPSSALWRSGNAVGPHHLVVLARRPVGIRHEGRSGVRADQGGAVLYDPWQAYTRRLLHPDGDVADVVGYSPELVDEAVGSSFGRSAAPLSDTAFLRQRTVFRDLACGAADPLQVQEMALLLLADVAGSALRTGPSRLVDRARAALADDLGERLGLAELGRRLHVSPYHLARVFREGTGTTLHAYREGLRLREAADRALAGQRLADVAADLGFASHSHLTHRFRRRYGTTPSALVGGAPGPQRGTPSA